MRLASELTGWKIDLYSSREWLDKGGEEQLFGSQGGDEEMPDVSLAELEGVDPAIAAVLEEAGYRTLNDIIDLDRDDFLRLPGIAPQEADRLVAIIEELTTMDEDEGATVAADAEDATDATDADDAADGTDADDAAVDAGADADVAK